MPPDDGREIDDLARLRLSRLTADRIVRQVGRLTHSGDERLSRLAADRIGVLFDVDFIARKSGEIFGSADEAVEAYFSLAAGSRFATTPLFDSGFYVSGPGWPGTPNLDPFAHFIAHVERGADDPHRLISLQTLRRQAGDGALLDRLCDALAGHVDATVHPLLHLAHIRSQPSGRGLSCADIFAIVTDVARPLPFSPHPLFCLSEYRRGNAPGLRNELWHYLTSAQGALRTHPLLSPAYVYAASTQMVATARRSLLEAYLEAWPDQPIDLCFLIDLKHLNHHLPSGGGEADRSHPLSRAMMAPIADASLLHPNLDSRLLHYAFGDLSASKTAPDLLRAALDIAAVPQATHEGRRGRPLVSVVMVVYYKPVYTALLYWPPCALSSLHHEIIVVENGGELIHHEELRRLFAAQPNVRITRLETNRYFGKGSNIGADIACGRYILFLKNDCLLAPDFGEELEQLIGGEASAYEALGALLIFPNGDIQEFGGIVTDDGQVVQRAKHLTEDFILSLPAVERVDYVSATCLCLSREALNEVGGFDPLFEPFYFEDTDLCRRLAKADVPVHVSSRLRAMHVENGSTREFLGANFDAHVSRNRVSFARRWLKEGGRDAYLALGPSVSTPDDKRPSALVYTPFDITAGGGERYLLSAARKLSETHDVLIATPFRMSRARVEFARHALGVSPFAFRIGPADEVVGSEGPFDVAFVMTNEIVPPLPPVARLNLLHLQFPFPWRMVGRTQFERLQGYDLILVNSDYTAGWTRKRLAEAGVRAPPPVEVLAPPVSFGPTVSKRPRRQGDPVRIVNVGRFFIEGHCKRQDIVLDIVRELRRQGVPTTATLICSIHRAPSAEAFFSEVQRKAQSLGGVEIVRDAGRSEIAAALANADVYLHACGFGIDVSLELEKAEHYGIAVAEAIQTGCYPRLRGRVNADCGLTVMVGVPGRLWG